MKRFLQFLFLSLIAFGVGKPLCADNHGTEIYGTVYEFGTGQEVPFADLGLIRGGKERYSTNSGSYGEYTFYDIEPSWYTLSVTASGYEPLTMRVKPKNKEMLFQNLFLIKKGLGISGYIMDAETEEPIEEGHILVFSGDSVVGEAEIHPMGVYLVKTDLSYDNYTVVIRAPGYREQELGVDLASENPFVVNAALVPYAGEPLSGKVTDAITKQGVSGVEVTVTVGEGPVFGEGKTDDQGNYSISGLSPGWYIVWFGGEGYRNAYKEVVVKEGENASLDLSLRRNPGRVSGQVVSAITGMPLESALIELHDGPLVVASTTSYLKGHFSLEDLDPGRYIIVATAEGHQPQSKGVAVESESSSHVSFRLQEAIEVVEGEVKDAVTGAPISGAVIKVFQGLAEVMTVYADGEGQYSISGLGEGNYVITVSAPGHQTISQGIYVDSEGTVILDFSLLQKPGKIQGQIWSSLTEDLIPGARVEIRFGATLTATVLTDESGRFVAPDLAPGMYEIIVTAAGYQRYIGKISVTADGTTTTHISLYLHPGFLAGTVFDEETKKVIEGATVSVFLGDKLVAFDLTDQKGLYDILHLAPGEYTVVAEASGYRRLAKDGKVTPIQQVVLFSIPFSFGATNVDFPLVEGGETIHVNVTDACLGTPLPGADVFLNEPPSLGVTDASGVLTLLGLSDGENHLLTVSKQGYATEKRNLQIVSGGSDTLSLSLEPVPFAPSSISCKALKNKFLVDTGFVCVIEWGASQGGCLSGYQILRDGVEIGFVGAGEKLEYVDYQASMRRHTYSVRAINSFGLVSDAVSINPN